VEAISAMIMTNVLGRIMNAADCAPWGAVAGRHVPEAGVFFFGKKQPENFGPLVPWSRTGARAPAFFPKKQSFPGRPLYTQAERMRRDASPWTMVQGILAPVQFLVFLVSLGLVLRFLLTGQGEQAATASVVVKTFVLYAIMVTGSFWERAIFGKFLFAPAFFWEDAVSMVVIALHTAYLAALLSGALDTNSLMLLALAAYATYLVNAAQFVLKLRAARLSAAAWPEGSSDRLGHA
jgi:3-vinyl bacteriochlorophyllide hydratase